jgi:Predicted NADH:ubiquinone oxidoreductase, subunit RnfB
MTTPVSSPIPSLVPETAPFTDEQRAWLNWFFAGLVSLDGSVTPLTAEQSAALMPGAPAGDGDDGEAPWHDQSLELPDRMKLAEGRPLRRRMMAAMAQQDCGQCGYNCNDYSEALFTKKEERLNLCVPGGKDTTRMLKKLYEEMDATPAAPAIISPPDEQPAPIAPAGITRDTPAMARLSLAYAAQQERLREGDLAYRVRPDRQRDRVRGRRLVRPLPDQRSGAGGRSHRAIGAPSDFPIGGRTLRDVLIEGVSLAPAPDMLFQLISYITGGERRQKARALAEGENPDGDAETLDVLAALEKFAGVRPTRKRSWKRSIRCSRGSTRLPARPRATRMRSRSPSTRCATPSTAAAALASPRRSSPNGLRPAMRSRPMSRKRMRSACRAIQQPRSS